MAKILLVDDDEILLTSLGGLLEAEKYRVESVSDGLEALEYLKTYDYDLVILDWQLPGMEGIEVCRRYRAEGGRNFIIMLTGQDKSMHKEQGLDCGADDYLTKPFDSRELLARIRARLRRPSEFLDDVLKCGPLSCNVKARAVSIISKDGQMRSLKLLPSEYALLEFLMRHPNEVFSPEVLLNRVWTADDDVSVDAVYVCLTRLRKKLDDKEGLQFIHNIHGVGYKLVPPS